MYSDKLLLTSMKDEFATNLNLFILSWNSNTFFYSMFRNVQWKSKRKSNNVHVYRNFFLRNSVIYFDEIPCTSVSLKLNDKDFFFFSRQCHAKIYRFSHVFFFFAIETSWKNIKLDCIFYTSYIIYIYFII